MFRQIVSRVSKFGSRRLQSTVSSPTLLKTEQWTTLSEAEKQKISTELAEVMKGDWNSVATENKRAGK